MIVVVVVAALFLMLLATGFAVAFIALAKLLGVQHSLGIDTQTSPNYDFVSGVGPMLIAALGFSGIGAGVLRHLNCHQDRCPKPGRFPVAGGQYKTCRTHHPDPTVREGIKAHHLLAAHQDHQRRR